MNLRCAFIGSLLSIGLVAATLPASAAGSFGANGHRAWSGTSVSVGIGHHAKGHRHYHGRRDHGRRHGHRGRPGSAHWPFHMLDHVHGGFGWHGHRGWRPHRHHDRGRHGPRRHRDWEDGAGIALGVLAGMILFNELTHPGNTAGGGTHVPLLDAQSRLRQGRAIHDVLEAGGSAIAAWDNPANRGGWAAGEVRITRNGRDDLGNPCREYHQTVRIGNRTEQGYRVACRDRSGNWRLR